MIRQLGVDFSLFGVIHMRQGTDLEYTAKIPGEAWGASILWLQETWRWSWHRFIVWFFLALQDSNQFHATCLDTYPPIFYMNDTSKKIANLVHAYNKHCGAIKVMLFPIFGIMGIHVIGHVNNITTMQLWYWVIILHSIIDQVCLGIQEQCIVGYS